MFKRSVVSVFYMLGISNKGCIVSVLSSFLFWLLFKRRLEQRLRSRFATFPPASRIPEQSWVLSVIYADGSICVPRGSGAPPITEPKWLLLTLITKLHAFQQRVNC